MNRSRVAVWIVAAGLAARISSSPAAAGDRRAEKILGESSLAAYWPLGDDLEDAKGRHPGRPVGGEIRFAPGPGSWKAAVLERERFVSLGECPDLDLDRMTVEMVFRLAEPAPKDIDQTLIASRDDRRSTRFSLHVMRTFRELAAWDGRVVWRFAPPGGEVRIGQWYHLAATWDGTDLRLFLDGVPCWGAGKINSAARGLSLQIGSSRPEPYHVLAGQVCQVAIYGDALAPEDIARNVTAGPLRDRHRAMLELERQRIEGELRADREKVRVLAGRRAHEAEALAGRMVDPVLFARGERRTYRGEHLTGISLPVGGIAAGPIQIDGRARRAIWQIFKNHPPVTLPDSFFAVRAKTGAGPEVVRVLQTVPEGPFRAMKDLRFSGEYPFGWYEFEDPDLPVAVSMEVFSPLIPLDARDSAIPCAIFNLTAENRGTSPVEVSFLAVQQNALGLSTGKEAIEGRSCPAYGGNSNRILRLPGATVLHMTGGQPKGSPAFGDMALWASAADAPANASWAGAESLFQAFAANGGPGRGAGGEARDAAGPSGAGQTLDGAIAVPFVLGPGQERSVPFILAWHFPDLCPVPGHPGNMYANWWPDALAVARDVAGRIDELTRLTRRYHDSLYETNLPRWLVDRIGSQVAILSSQTCNWARDGFFYAWEGCNPEHGCCSGNATHVWGYPMAHARLFPGIARRMREEEYAHQKPDGMIAVRFDLDFPAFDGMCSAVLSAWREHLSSPDDAWLRKNWPSIRKAMDYMVVRWDADEDGLLRGPQHGMDGDQGGTSSWMGSMYLGALTAAERMALLVGDGSPAGRYRRIREAGSAAQDRTLFNGEYFTQMPDPVPRQDYLTGCYIDQLLGQWWALQVDLGWLYPIEHVRSSMRSLFRYNFHTDYRGLEQAPRKFVDDADAGMQQGTWPLGGRPRPPHCIQYADEVMSGFEYAAATLMFQTGLEVESLTVLRAAWERYDGRLRTGLTPGEFNAWGYSGNPFGDDECGKFYTRAMSVWGMLIAAQGFTYDGPAGVIGFAPLWRPHDHVSFFTAAEGWGVFRQRRTGSWAETSSLSGGEGPPVAGGAGSQRDEIELRYGRLAVGTLFFEPPEGRAVSSVTAALAGQAVPVRRKLQGQRLCLRLDAPVTIRAGQTLVIMLR
jgi:non-lysosomal glucosylceramidase